MRVHGMVDIKQYYFNWLCDLVHIDQEDRSYWLLARDLYHRKFVPIVNYDENRAYDGIELRDECLQELGYPRHHDLGEECSVLEMMVALAQRMDFETSDPYEDDIDKTAYWFWEMIDNLGLTAFDDDSYVELEGQIYVDAIIDALVERRYSWTGDGGLFPLENADEDQRDVEILYQMSAYLAEKEAG